MGYHDSEPTIPLELLLSNGEPNAKEDERLSRRMRQDQGRPVCSVEQLNRLEQGLGSEERVEVQYDRFKPRLPGRSINPSH